MAFGNSITEGKNAFSQAIANNYPAVLRGMLTTRYSSQSIAVFNRGFGGERAVDGAKRLENELDTLRPEVLLLEEGVNDLAGGDPAAISPMIEALRTMVRQAKSRATPVYLATLTPVRAGGTPRPRGDGPLPLLSEANARIRILAQSERVILVDLYEGFGGSPDPFIDSDGLHPNEAGYRRIAEIFFGVIRSTLETPSVTGPVFVRNFPAPSIPGDRLP
jgi:lysophospholipase L1-like esterase